MARNRVRQAGANHDKLVLALAFRSAGCPADGIVQSAQLTLRSGVHIAHPAHHNVRLVVEIQTITDQLVQVDFGRSLAPPLTRAPLATAEPLFTAAIAVSLPPAIIGPSIPWSPLAWTR